MCATSEAYNYHVQFLFEATPIHKDNPKRSYLETEHDPESARRKIPHATTLDHEHIAGTGPRLSDCENRFMETRHLAEASSDVRAFLRRTCGITPFFWVRLPRKP